MRRGPTRTLHHALGEYPLEVKAPENELAVLNIVNGYRQPQLLQDENGSARPLFTDPVPFAARLDALFDGLVQQRAVVAATKLQLATGASLLSGRGPAASEHEALYPGIHVLDKKKRDDWLRAFWMALGERPLDTLAEVPQLGEAKFLRGAVDCRATVPAPRALWGLKALLSKCTAVDATKRAMFAVAEVLTGVQLGAQQGAAASVPATKAPSTAPLLEDARANAGAIGHLQHLVALMLEEGLLPAEFLLGVAVQTKYPLPMRGLMLQFVLPFVLLMPPEKVKLFHKKLAEVEASLGRPLGLDVGATVAAVDDHQQPPGAAVALPHIGRVRVALCHAAGALAARPPHLVAELLVDKMRSLLSNDAPPLWPAVCGLLDWALDSAAPDAALFVAGQVLCAWHARDATPISPTPLRDAICRFAVGVGAHQRARGAALVSQCVALKLVTLEGIARWLMVARSSLHPLDVSSLQALLADVLCQSPEDLCARRICVADETSPNAEAWTSAALAAVESGAVLTERASPFVAGRAYDALLRASVEHANANRVACVVRALGVAGDWTVSALGDDFALQVARHCLSLGREALTLALLQRLAAWPRGAVRVFRPLRADGVLAKLSAVAPFADTAALLLRACDDTQYVGAEVMSRVAAVVPATHRTLADVARLVALAREDLLQVDVDAVAVLEYLVHGGGEAPLGGHVDDAVQLVLWACRAAAPEVLEDAVTRVRAMLLVTDVQPPLLTMLRCVAVQHWVALGSLGPEQWEQCMRDVVTAAMVPHVSENDAALAALVISLRHLRRDVSAVEWLEAAHRHASARADLVCVERLERALGVRLHRSAADDPIKRVDDVLRRVFTTQPREVARKNWALLEGRGVGTARDWTKPEEFVRGWLTRPNAPRSLLQRLLLPGGDEEDDDDDDDDDDDNPNAQVASGNSAVDTDRRDVGADDPIQGRKRGRWQ